MYNLPKPKNQHYFNRYLKFIEYALTRPLPEGYSENHHICPRSFGGNNDIDNLIRLTGREYYIAHWILWKAYSCLKTTYAFNMMQLQKLRRNYKVVPSFIYERLRTEVARANSERQKGKKLSPETCAKMSASKKGVPMTSVQMAACLVNAEKRRGKPGYKRSEAQKQHQSDMLKGRPFSQDHKDKIGAANRNKPKPTTLMDYKRGKVVYNNGKDHQYFIKGTIIDGWTPGRITTLFTNGIIDIRAIECPVGFWKGTCYRWWTDGTKNTRALVAPSDNFRLGKIQKPKRQLEE
jgi:hypothetical protein